MRALIAPTAFKGTLSASEAARAMSEGLLSARPDAKIIQKPIADGGDGFLEVIAASRKTSVHRVQAHDALMRSIEAEYLMLEDGAALIELAKTAGLARLNPSELNAREASTYGVGEMIDHALANGAKKIVCGLGGSATNDAGSGLLRALGFLFLDKEGEPHPQGGAALIELHRIVPPPSLPDAEFVCACDVTNLLCGAEGASAVYAPQKGADPQTVALLDAALLNFGRVAERETGKNVCALPGGGAAGGTSAGMAAFLNAEIVSGIEFVFDLIGFREALESSDMLLTGEGSFDRQSMYGKAVGEAIKLAHSKQIPSSLFCGRIDAGEDLFRQYGVKIACAINSPDKAFEALKNSVKDAFSEN